MQQLQPTFVAANFPLFFDLYHAHTSEADFAANPIDVQRAATLRHLALGYQRQRGEVVLDVFTPSQEVEGWGGSHSVVQLVMDDMPFVVDSLTAALSRLTRGVVRVLHPILPVARDESGRVAAVGPASGGASESWVEFVIQRLLTPAAHEELARELRAVVDAVVSVNADWQAMRSIAVGLAEQWRSHPPQSAEADEISEAADLLDWFAENHFTFLGYRHLRLEQDQLVADADSGLGLYRGKPGSATAFEEMSPSAKAAATSGAPLVIARGGLRSLVHRAVYPEHVAVKEFDAGGRVVGEHRFIGLLSRDAFTDSVRRIPIARTATATVLEHSGWLPGSHSYKDLLQFLENFPRSLLLQVEPEWLVDTALTAVENESRQATQVFWHTDPWGRFADFLVYVPRDIYNTAMRQRIESLLRQALDSTALESAVRLAESPMASLHFTVRLSGGATGLSEVLPELVTGVRAATRSWSVDFADRVVAQSESDFAAEQAIALWGGAFDDAYKASYSVAEAWADAVAADPAGLSVRVQEDAQGNCRVRLIAPGTPLKLSAVLPVLAAFGLDVSDEQPFELTPASGTSFWLHDLGFTAPAPLDPTATSRLEQALRQSFAGELEVDELLRLVLTAGLTAREVAALRTYASYLAQWGTFSAAAVQAALVGNPAIAGLLFAEFTARLSPAGGQARSAELSAAIDAVASLEDDRVLRAMAATIAATARTNFFQKVAGAPRPTIAIKVKCEQLDMLPSPRPFAEIWVESPRVRGVHLRFGAVARGGLRWSDRRDDMRTEVLGLVRAQVVKNSVIVPTGSKGGFFGKQLPDPSNRDAWLAAGVAAYEEFINALLDLTDNRVGESVTPPADTVRHDGDDPYLVVAADKGTATFSDIANAIALERGFWLGDAFASGGSVGYDHKAMGITARGAWESVKHHFALLGVDPESDPITVVGIGDMSGDVFGNGLLLSKSVRLVAAFDHRHIFLDPTPNAAAAWAERKRLFELPRSSWADYDPNLISAGGGVFARSEKSVPITAETAQVLGISPGECSPLELISAILKAPVDLLWNGGIGTYVKATAQSHAQVGDKANDGIRINGSELRCRVVGEGGNLGFTQAGRIEAARCGVRLNTDAIDNSAGVDTSDHEVNLKILFSLRPADRLSLEQRNQLLASLTDEVAALVLADNIAQNEVLTIAASHGGDMAHVHSRVISDWAATGEVDRLLEDLPSEEEFSARLAEGKGLTKPELSVLLAHAKIQLTHALLLDDTIDESWADTFLIDYFPTAVRREYQAEILSHPLRREIKATAIANFVVNQAGITAVWRAAEETGAPLSEIARAMVLAVRIGGLHQVFADIAALGSTKWQARIVLLKEVRRFIDRVARWLIANRGNSAALLRDLPRFEAAVETVEAKLGEHLHGYELERWQRQTAGYAGLGVPEELAAAVAGLLDVYAALDLVDLAGDQSDRLVEWSATYFAISDELGGDQLLGAISRLPRADRWETMARAALRADMYAVLAAVTDKVVAAYGELPLADRVNVWLSAQGAPVARVKALLTELRDREQSDIAAISVALRMLRALVTQTGAGQ